MIQQNKKGFSLIEVMLLFMVLSVVLAASIPLISRKSSPVPNPINHGVYRCFYSGDAGSLMEELYTGSRQVKPPTRVDVCTFTVPKAALYRVDLYSSGAGGTAAATFDSAMDDFRSAYFNTDRADYSDFKVYIDKEHNNMIENPQSSRQSIVRELTDHEIQDFFRNEYIIRYASSGAAGDGGSAGVDSYYDPFKSECNGFVLAKSKAATNLENKQHQYDPTHDDFDSTLKTSLKKQEESTQNITKAEAAYAEADKNDKQYSALKDSLNDINDFINALKTSFSAKKNYELLMRMEADPVFTYYLGGDESNVGKVGNYFTKGLKPELTTGAAETKAGSVLAAAEEAFNKAQTNYVDNKKKKAGQDAYDAAIADGKTEDEANAAGNKAMADFDEDQAAEEFAKNHSYGDYMGKCGDDYKKEETSGLIACLKKDITDDERAKEFYNNASEKYSYDTKGTNVNKAYNDAVSIYDNITKSKGNLDALITEAGGKSFKEQAQDAAEDILKYKGEYQTALDTYNKRHDDLTKEAAALQKLYNEIEKSGLTEILEEKGYNRIPPSRTEWVDGEAETYEYFGAPNIMDWPADKINDPSASTKGNTARQISDYCKARYLPLATTEQEKKDFANFTFNTSSAYRLGQAAYKSKYIRLKYPITFRAPSGEAGKSYSVMQYLKNLSDPNSIESIHVYKCKGLNGNGYANDCIPSDNTYGGEIAGYGNDNTVESYEDYRNTGAFEYTAPNRVLKATKGEDLKPDNSKPDWYPYTAFHLPYYQAGVPKGALASNIAVMTNYPTGGFGGQAWINETRDGTYVSKTYAADAETSEIAKIFDKNYSFKISGGSYENYKNMSAKDAVFNNGMTYKIYDDMSVFATLNALDWKQSTRDDPMYKDIKVQINTALWTKKYYLGRGGGAGRNASYIISNLGSECTFDINPGGEPYDMFSEQDSDSRKILEVLQDKLVAGITCRNRDGRVIFARELPGGRYNTSLTDVNNNNEEFKFYWNKDLTAFHVNAGDSTRTTWHPTSMWAKVFNNFMMNGGNGYDLSTRYNIGMGGSGTDLIDRCIEPKGYYNVHKLYVISYYGGEDDIYKTETIDKGQASANTFFPGKKGEIDCYGVGPDGLPTTDNILYPDDPDVSLTAGHGGGGAVVITW